MKKILISAAVVMLIMIPPLFSAPLDWNEVTVSGADANDICLFPGAWYGSHVFLGSENTSGNGGKLWGSDDGAVWTPIIIDGLSDSNNRGVRTFPEPFDGRIMLHTINNVTGVEVWSSASGSSGTWIQTNTDG